ncbi:DNA-binding protein, partial [Streptomyces sp. SID10244]|nr:DNA-binding protein [Streptomyces sp. SID10244]
TLSQTGMVRHWTRHLRTETDPRARRRMMQSRVINSIGLVMTATVLVVVLITKFRAGAWIAILAMVALFVIMKLIHRHYATVQHELELEEDEPVLPSRTHSIVL